MKLISKEIVINYSMGGEVDCLLSHDEAIEHLKLMQKTKAAWLDVFFGRNMNALKELRYKRYINLDDGRILANAWCKNITEQEDGTFIATYAFERIKVTCKSCHSILRFSQWDIWNRAANTGEKCIICPFCKTKIYIEDLNLCFYRYYPREGVDF